MGESLENGPLTIREPYNPMCRTMFLVSADRLIGGGGTTALRITYTHKSGEERKLTFLTDQAAEADQHIASQRTR